MADQELLVLNPRPLSNLSLLDEKTIFKICEYLSLYDVFQIGELDINYQRIIGVHIISKRTLDISEISKHYPVRDVFRHYGEFVTALSIKESDIQYKSEDYTYAEEIFRLIKKRCVPSRLKTVTICFDKDDRKREINASRFLDVFAELESLVVTRKTQSYRTGRDKPLEKLLGKLLVNCRNLRSLKLVELWDHFDFLMLPELRDLHSLWFDRCEISYNGWLNFVKAGVRPLKSMKIEHISFRITNRIDHGEFHKQIVEAFPNLETFTYRSIYDKFVNHNCEALGQLRQLKEVAIVGCKYSNLISSLAASNTVEKLSLSFTGIVGDSESITSLQNLRSVEFWLPKINHIHNYLRFCLLPNVTECIFSGDRHIDDLDKMLQGIIACPFNPNFTVLKVLAKHAKFLSSFYDSLVSARSIYQISLPPGLKKALHLHANFRPLRNYKPDIITIHNHN